MSPQLLGLQQHRLPRAQDEAIHGRITSECEQRLRQISERTAERWALRERLGERVEMDLDTSRRLFTLICVLHIRG